MPADLPVVPASFHFIIPTPDHNTGVVAETLNLLDRLLPHIYLELYVSPNHVAAETEFLPDEESELITDVVEIVGFVKAASPFPHHVHVSIASSLE